MSTVLDKSLSMGGSCFSELAAEKKKTKQLEEKVKLYEAGITDSSLHEMHSSQTNIGLLNVATENNTNGCDCSSTSLLGVLEVLALLVVCVLFLYIGYNCLVSYCTRKKMAKEKQHRKLMEHVETELRPNQMRAIEMSPTAPDGCSRAHMHIPDHYQVRPQNTPQQNQSTQESPTFD